MSATTTAPLNGIVYITSRIGSQTYQASGVMIAPNLVLTASHVVWETGVGSATTITVAPGYGSGIAPYAVAYGVSYNFNPIDDFNDQATIGSVEDDYAVIKLGVSYSGPTVFSLGSDFTGGAAYVTGYPASAGGALVSPVQVVTPLSGTNVLVGSALGPGSSGGPVWAPGADGTPTIYGLISAGNTQGTGFFNGIDSSELSQIQEWIAQDEVPSPPLTVFDATANSTIQTSGSAYVGPVAGLQHTYADITTDNLNITATTPNWFIATGSGNDAITVTSGNNVIDGGGGSNFLTGGVGNDTFFINANQPGQTIWTTVNQFHIGDYATLWGVSAADSPLSDWFSNQGAAGYTGLTLHTETASGTAASLTLAGYSQADLFNGRLAIAYGVDSSDRPYMVIAGTG